MHRYFGAIKNNVDGDPALLWDARKKKQLQPKRALQLLQSMLSRRFRPDVITCNALISACGKGGPPEWALQPLESIKSERRTPIVIIYTVLISACGKCEQPERAFPLFESVPSQRVGWQCAWPRGMGM